MRGLVWLLLGALPLRAAELVVEEYRVCRVGEDRPDHFEYRQLIPPTVLARREAQRGFPRYAGELDRLNVELARCGYRLEPSPGEPRDHPREVDLIGPAGVTERQLEGVREVFVDEAGGGFVMLAYRTIDGTGQPLLIRNGHATPVALEYGLYHAPILVGGALLTIALRPDAEQHSSGPGMLPLQVRRDGQPIFNFEAKERVADETIKQFRPWRGGWLLEWHDHVVIDGQPVGDGAFGFDLVAGEPCGFVLQDGRAQLSFGGQARPYVYDEVIHDACCEPAMFNLAANDTMLWFHARRDGWWWYVEAGVDD